MMNGERGDSEEERACGGGCKGVTGNSSSPVLEGGSTCLSPGLRAPTPSEIYHY